MIRFSASLVVVAIGLLVGGVVTSKLVLVYMAIAVSVTALVALGVGVALAEALAEALVDALALGVGVALVLLTDTAVSWAAHGFVAAGAGVALPISKIPVSPARRIRNPEIRRNARVAARCLLMDNALATVVIPVRVALVAMVSPVNAGSIPP